MIPFLPLPFFPLALLLPARPSAMSMHSSRHGKIPTLDIPRVRASSSLPDSRLLLGHGLVTSQFDESRRAFAILRSKHTGTVQDIRNIRPRTKARGESLNLVFRDIEAVALDHVAERISPGLAERSQGRVYARLLFCVLVSVVGRVYALLELTSRSRLLDVTISGALRNILACGCRSG